nr:hypothetical protein B0A51_01238 [Rachicladosporium sp. CCFEE 5018]
MADFTFDGIDKGTFNSLLKQYPTCVPDKLGSFDEQRFNNLPGILAKRNGEGKVYLTKEEVATLVDWKLSHGTFRPSLKGLVLQNSPEFVLEVTTDGLSTSSDDNLEARLKTLCKLKGIGPATASLLLAVNDPDTVPFFSDELFRWASWKDETAGRWDRKIKYTPKEYRELVARVADFRSRVESVSAAEIEKVAYVLGKREQDLAITETASQARASTGNEGSKSSTKRKASPEEAVPAAKEKPKSRKVANARELQVSDQKGSNASRRSTRSMKK